MYLFEHLYFEIRISLLLPISLYSDDEEQNTVKVKDDIKVKKTNTKTVKHTPRNPAAVSTDDDEITIEPAPRPQRKKKAAGAAPRGRGRGRGQRNQNDSAADSGRDHSRDSSGES